MVRISFLKAHCGEQMGRGQERRQEPSEEAVVALQMEEDGD